MAGIGLDPCTPRPLLFRASPPSDPAASQEGYGIVNARAALRLNNGFTIAVFGRNLADERYIQRVTNLQPIGFLMAIPAIRAPMEYRPRKNSRTSVGEKTMKAGSVFLSATAMILALGATVPAAAADAPAKLPDWADYLEAMKPIGERMIVRTQHPDNPQDRQDTWRVLMATLAQGYQAVIYNDPSYPEFVAGLSTILNVAAPNPDYLYRSAMIDGAGVYRLRGKRGTNRFTLISLSNGYYALGNAKPNTGSHDLDELKLGPDGSFSVILSKERPAGYTGDWWYLDPKTTGIGMRLASYEWGKEQESQVGIERLDVPSSAPRLTAAESDRRMKLLATWVEEGTKIWFDRVAQMHKDNLVNALMVHDYSNMGGAEGQIYVEGLFDLKPDEGLLLTAKVPDTCKYWSFMIGNEQFQTIDWMQHQSSLNATQAKVDKDGIVRMVISPSDPGVPNWLDTGGYGQGIIQIRWNKCSSAPTPSATKVKLASLRANLPKETPVITPAERETRLRDRRLAAQMRIRW